MLAFGALANFSGELSAGALIACLILTWRTLTPFHNFCAVIQRFEQIRNSIMQIDALMEIAAGEEDRDGGAALASFRGRVAFENVGLQLGARSTPLFMNMTFAASPGETIGFTGHSGSGKSLILKLVQGVYDASLGAVRIDGFDIRQLDTDRLRRLISYIPQQPQLFSGTIEENLTSGSYGRRPLSTKSGARLQRRAPPTASSFCRMEYRPTSSGKCVSPSICQCRFPWLGPTSSTAASS
jgi:ABC-type bacteriocin/lantibiotic exporter with double-glycine peptidase domain